MLTVTISINAEPIYTRTVVQDRKSSNGCHVYTVDDGSEIIHRRSDGAVALAIKALGTIKEQGVALHRLADERESA